MRKLKRIVEKHNLRAKYARLEKKFMATQALRNAAQRIAEIEQAAWKAGWDARGETDLKKEDKHEVGTYEEQAKKHTLRDDIPVEFTEPSVVMESQPGDPGVRSESGGELSRAHGRVLDPERDARPSPASLDLAAAADGASFFSCCPSSPLRRSPLRVGFC